MSVVKTCVAVSGVVSDTPHQHSTADVNISYNCGTHPALLTFVWNEGCLPLGCYLLTI